MHKSMYIMGRELSTPYLSGASMRFGRMLLSSDIQAFPRSPLPLLYFQLFTAIKFCNFFVLTTIQNAGVYTRKKDHHELHNCTI